MPSLRIWSWGQTMTTSAEVKQGNRRKRSSYKRILLSSGISQEKVRSLFDYNPQTGEFIRKHFIVGSSFDRVGKPAGTISADGYCRLSIDKRLYLLHRLIWLWHYGYLPESEIDHVDRDRGNNRIENLREVSTQCNSKNKDVRSDNKTGVTGVFWYERYQAYQASIRVNGSSIHLGYYAELIEAVCHRLAAEQCLSWSVCATITCASKFVEAYRCRTSE